jgi:pimeloyl-ACP methyl ester carboxylesterase
VRGTEEVSAGDFSATSLRCFKASRRAVGRVTLAQRDPRGFAVFKQALAEHSALGAANTQLGCQKERLSLYHLENEIAGLTVPTLILTGDEDWPCLTPALLMKRTIPSAALSVMPNCGHTINLEAPDLFNSIVGDFIAQVDAGRWPTRDPRAMSGYITGIR